MPPAPVVQNLSDIVNTIGQAYAPQKALIDQSIAANDASGTAQQAGLAAKKDQSFSNIDQTATNRGMAFSGFTPDAEAKYIGTSYLPALANLQTTIANTRNNLLGKKAALDTQANTEAFNTQQNQQKELNAWNAAQAAAQRAEQARIATEQFQASENAKNRSASMAAASARAASRAPSAADRQNAFNQQLTGLFDGYQPGKDKFYTEHVVIPTLMAQSGLSSSQVAKQVYDYRKAQFGE